jgi:hypothetical protein
MFFFMWSLTTVSFASVLDDKENEIAQRQAKWMGRVLAERDTVSHKTAISNPDDSQPILLKRADKIEPILHNPVLPSDDQPILIKPADGLEKINHPCKEAQCPAIVLDEPHTGEAIPLETEIVHMPEIEDGGTIKRAPDTVNTIVNPGNEVLQRKEIEAEARAQLPGEIVVQRTMANGPKSPALPAKQSK